MTNNEKLGEIRAYIDKAVYDAASKANSDDLPSAKWIYVKGQSDMAKRIRDVVIDILSLK